MHVVENHALMVQKAHTEVCARTRQGASAQKAEDAPITMDGERSQNHFSSRWMMI
jgi:hypothetical protein